MVKKRLFIDMDGVLCDYMKAHTRQLSSYNPYPQSRARFFENLEEIPDAVGAVNHLREHFDVWILTSPSYLNPLCYTEKRVWIEEHFDLDLCYKLILCTNKSLLRGDILIDDHDHDFEGELIKFGSHRFPDWKSIMGYFGLGFVIRTNGQ